MFPNFRYYDNKGWYESFSLAHLNPLTTKTPHKERIAYIIIISVTSRVMANFVYKFITFRYCVNKGWSSKRLNDNVHVANTENPLFGAKMWGPMSQLMENLVLKHQICFYHSNSGSSAETWITVKLIDLQNTQFRVQKSKTYLKFEPIYVDIVRKFAILVTIATGVGLTQVACILKLTARKPSIWCKNLGDIWYNRKKL